MIVGCGGISPAWLKPLSAMDDVELIGMVDLDRTVAEGRAAEYAPGAAIYTDLSAALAELSPDVVFDCTVPSAHAKIDVQALEAGCHVMCEKPLADTMEAARCVVAAARSTGRTHAVMQNRRYLPDIRRFRRLIADGSIGRPTMLTADFFIGAHFGGFRAEMDHVLLLDMAIHTFDAARMILDARPVSASCTEWNPHGSWYTHGAAAVALFEMDNGARFSYRGSWCAEGMNTSWESAWRIVGDGGSATWDGGAQIAGEAAGSGDTLIRAGIPIEPPASVELELTGHAGCIRGFLDSLGTGKAPETASHDNIASLAMCLAAVESAETGRTIAIDLEAV